jgi:hypothetical protein
MASRRQTTCAGRDFCACSRWREGLPNATNLPESPRRASERDLPNVQNSTWQPRAPRRNATNIPESPRPASERALHNVKNSRPQRRTFPKVRPLCDSGAGRKAGSICANFATSARKTLCIRSETPETRPLGGFPISATDLRERPSQGAASVSAPNHRRRGAAHLIGGGRAGEVRGQTSAAARDRNVRRRDARRSLGARRLPIGPVHESRPGSTAGSANFPLATRSRMFTLALAFHCDPARSRRYL